MAMTELRTAIPEEIDRYLDSLVNSGPFTSKAELVRAALAAYTSMAGPMAQVFDKENIYSPDGRIYQVEYARESALRGPPAVGISYRKGALLACKVVHLSPLVGYSKIEHLSDQVAACPTGLRADGYVVLRGLRRARPKSLPDLIDALTTLFWERTAERHLRPFGTILLIATLFGSEPSILCFNPSGSHVRGKALAMGRGHQRVQAHLNLSYRNGNATEAEELARTVLGKLDKTEEYEIHHLKC